jgi:uncharacterized protein (TIRG00374 family)
MHGVMKKLDMPMKMTVQPTGLERKPTLMPNRSHTKFFFKLLISTAILGFIFWKVPFGEIMRAIQTADIGLILMSLLLVPVMFTLNAAHTKVLADKQIMSLSLGQIIEINLTTIFYGLFLPGTIAGGVIKWYKFSESQGKKSEAFAVILFNRYYDTIILCVIGVMFCLLDNVARQNTYAISALVMTCLALGLCGLMGHTPKAIDYLQQMLPQLPFRADVIRRVLTKVTEAVKQFHNLTKTEFIKITLLIAAKHIIGIITFVLFALAVQIELSFVNLGWIRTSIMIFMMLPISVAGLGIREGGLIIMFQLYDVAPQQAIVFSLLLLGRNIIAGLVGGLLECRRIFRDRHV